MDSEKLDVTELDDTTVQALWCALVHFVDDIATDPPEDVWQRIEEIHSEVNREWDRRNGYVDE